MTKNDIIMNVVDKMLQDFDGKQKVTKKESKIYFCNLFIEKLKNMTGEELEKHIQEIYGDMNQSTIHFVFSSKFLEERKKLWKAKNKKYFMF